MNPSEESLPPTGKKKGRERKRRASHFYGSAGFKWADDKGGNLIFTVQEALALREVLNAAIADRWSLDRRTEGNAGIKIRIDLSRQRVSGWGTSIPRRAREA